MAETVTAPQVAIAQELGERSFRHPEGVREAHCNLLLACEERRLLEEQRQGKRFMLRHLGFRSYPERRVIECRAVLVEVDPATRVRADADGYTRWDGPRPTLGDIDWTAPPPEWAVTPAAAGAAT